MSAPTTQAGTVQAEVPVTLLPCPFCGGSPTLHPHSADHSLGAWVSCSSCGLESPTETGQSVAVAVRHWNTRSTRDTETAALQAELEHESKESYEIGKRDGYEKAVQHIDERTGGDGEYCCVVGHDADDRHCPDPESMIARIVGRFEKLSTAEQQLSELRAEMETVRGERDDARREIRTAREILRKIYYGQRKIEGEDLYEDVSATELQGWAEDFFQDFGGLEDNSASREGVR